MDIVKAEEILNNYRQTLEKGTEGNTILRRKSLLANSKVTIKYAFYKYLEENYLELNNEEIGRLVEEYSLLTTFVPDTTVKKYATAKSEWQTKKSDILKSRKDEQPIKQYLAFTHTLGTSEAVLELNEYIEELKKGVK